MGCGFLADGAASGERGGGGHSLPQTNSSSSSSSEVVALSQKRLLQPPPLQASLRRPPAEWTTLKLAPDSTILYLALYRSALSRSPSFLPHSLISPLGKVASLNVKTTIVHLSSFSFCRRHRRRNHRIVCLIGCEICLNIVAFVAD